MLLRHFQPQQAHLRNENLPLYDLDDEMAELLFKTVQKLEGMTDAEFDEYYIVPDSLFED